VKADVQETYSLIKFLGYVGLKKMEVINMYKVDQYTVSLLHFDGGLTDENGKMWAAQNGATVSTTQSNLVDHHSILTKHETS
jgi:hypothetical protein